MKKKKINYFIVEVDPCKVDVMVVVGDIEGAIEWLSNKNVTDSDIESFYLFDKPSLSWQEHNYI